ncbi:MAG: hypothetical protein ACJART_001319 [Maribacter sp.]|jgi:hypothetical protein
MYFKNIEEKVIELFIFTLFTNYAQIVNNQLLFKATKNPKCFNFVLHESIHGIRFTCVLLQVRDRYGNQNKRTFL